jgi:hypothetical protein
MDDRTYLDSSEINFFIKNLFAQVSILRPEDSVEYAFQYFIKVRSCQNVLGADYGFISGCNKNRRAFVFCLIELFKTFSDDEEMSINECHQIIEMICPNFPTTIMPSVVSSLEVKNANASPPKYRHGDMRVSLYFHIIYDEWLKYIMTVFKEEGSLECLGVFRLNAYIEDCRKNKRVNFSQPPQACIDEALTRLNVQDVSFAMLKKVLFATKATEMDVTKVSKHTVTLIGDPPQQQQKKDNAAQQQQQLAAAPASTGAAAAGGRSDSSGRISAASLMGGVTAAAATTAGAGAGGKGSKTSKSKKGKADSAAAHHNSSSEDSDDDDDASDDV